MSIWLSTLFVVASFICAEGSWQCPQYACKNDTKFSYFVGDWVMESSTDLKAPCVSYNFLEKDDDSMLVSIFTGFFKGGALKTEWYLSRGEDGQMRMSMLKGLVKRTFCVSFTTDKYFIIYECTNYFGFGVVSASVFVRPDSLLAGDASVADDWMNKNGVKIDKLNRKRC